MAGTGIEGSLVLKNGRLLRRGYTTGTCAAAAAKAAAAMLFLGEEPVEVRIKTPKGLELRLDVLNPVREEDRAVCAVRKFSGDDPDVTDGMLIFAEVRRSTSPGVKVEGGEGIGRVTKPGLRRNVGEAAINPVPLGMIEENVSAVLRKSAPDCGAEVVIFAPEGREIAKKTFNPRLGIEGGISILGTSGIVEPMSEAALVESIGLEIRQKKALGAARLIVCPGNYGADFLRGICGIDDNCLVKCSNYVGEAIDMAAEAGFGELLLAGHVGKFIKLTGGMFDTHSRRGDCRAELMAACAIKAGCGAETALRLLESVTTEDMLDILEKSGFLEKTLACAAEKTELQLRRRSRDGIEVSALVFSSERGLLYTTGNAEKWLAELKSGVAVQPGG